MGRREVTNWYDSPDGGLRETTESVVTQPVRILGRDCFPVRVRSWKPGETKPDLIRGYKDLQFEHFFVDEAGTHWVRPKRRWPDFADDDAWEILDAEEGVSPVEVSTERPEANSTVEVVDLTIGGETVRCLRETFFEVEGGRVRYGGDVFRREDGTSILYYRLLAEGMKEYDALAGAPEYELGGATLRVWETVRLVGESDLEGLQRLVSLEFAETPLSEAVRSLQAMSKCDVVLDPRAVPAHGDVPITLRVANMCLDSTFEWVLVLAGLQLAVVDNAIFISTPETAARVQASGRIPDLPAGPAIRGRSPGPSGGTEAF